MKEKIKAAFPTGFYAAPGVLSLGGYRCVTAREDESIWMGNGIVSLPSDVKLEDVQSDIENGDFLPDFSFKDRATWTHLMIYLGSLHTATTEEAQYLDWCFAWVDAEGVLKDPCWGLIGHSSAAYPAGPMFLFPDILTDNIEEALLEAIISSQNKAKS